MTLLMKLFNRKKCFSLIKQLSPIYMSLIKLNIKGISYSQTQNGAYALILSEENGPRKLPIVIGAFEAQSIAIALESDIKPPRPLTHDLFKIFCDQYAIRIKQVIIHKLVDGVFYSSIITEQNNHEEIVESRTSDAIALALRFDAPVFTYKDILKKAGVYLQTAKDKSAEKEEGEEKLTIESLTQSKASTSEPNLSSKSITELNSMLQIAVAAEEYEKAASIRDEISKRKD